MQSESEIARIAVSNVNLKWRRGQRVCVSPAPPRFVTESLRRETKSADEGEANFAPVKILQTFAMFSSINITNDVVKNSAQRLIGVTSDVVTVTSSCGTFTSSDTVPLCGF
jgi:hypothetical protein